MKLTDIGKNERMEELWKITKACYSGTELPTRSYFARCVQTGHVFIKTFCDKVVGYALLQDEGYMLLTSVAVLAPFRGQGRAGELMEECADWCKEAGYSRIILHCKVSNPAQKLYFDMGYRAKAVLKNYYAPEGDGLEMEKIL